MAIITKPTIAKGQANEFDLSKSDLAVLSKVTSDSYFSDQANWSKVYIEYKSTEGKQHEMVIFDASQTTPKGSFDISDKSKDSWEVQALVIMDFDGGYLKLERGDLTVENFDIALGSVGSDIGNIIGTAIEWDNVPSNVTLLDNGGIDTQGNNVDVSKSNMYTGGDIDLEFTFLGSEVVPDYAIGFTYSAFRYLTGFYYDSLRLKYRIVYRGTVVVDDLLQSGDFLPEGLNTFRMKKVGNSIIYYFNGVEKYVSSANSVYPGLYVRLVGKRLESAVIL